MKLLRDFILLIRDAVVAWYSDGASRLAAALSFYAILSAAPLLILLVGLLGIFLDQQAVQTFITVQIQDLAGPEIANSLSNIIARVPPQESGLVATIISIGVLFFAAGGMFDYLHYALNLLWKLPPPPDSNSILEMIRGRLVASLMILLGGGVLLVSMVASALVGIFSERLIVSFPNLGMMIKGVNPLLLFGIIFSLFVLTFRFLPDGQITWRAVLPGALFTTVLFTIGEAFINLYLSHVSFDSVYGTAGSLVAVILWVYYSAQIFLLGAEFTYLYAQRHGPGIKPRDHASYWPVVHPLSR